MKDRYVVKVLVNNDVSLFVGYHYFFPDYYLVLSSTVESNMDVDFVFTYDIASDIVKSLSDRFGIVSFIFNFDEV